jgi:ABC-type enterobactin transport system permease subunit
LADRMLGFEVLFLPIGLVLGLVGSIYLIITQYVRS